MAELLAQVRDVVEIELRPDENMVGQINLNSGADVQVGMICSADGFGGRRTHCRADAAALRNRETGARKSNPAEQAQFNAFVANRSEDSIEINEGLPELERPIVSLFRL